MNYGIASRENLVGNEKEAFMPYVPSSDYDEGKDRRCLWTHMQASRRFWEYMIFAITLITPIEMSYVILFNRHFSMSGYSIFFLLDVLQVIDNFVIVLTPITQHGVLITKPGEVIKDYGIVPFIMHVIASLPLGWIGIITDNIWLYTYLSVIRLFRLHRAYQAYKTIYISTFYTGSINHLFPQFILFIFVVHVFACIMYILATTIGTDSFMGPYLDKSPIEKYTVSMYFVITTILSVGYGDIHPIHTSECIVAIVMEVVGVAFEALIVAKMVNALSDAQGNSFIVKYDSIQSYIKSKGVSRMFTNHVRHYYQTVWEKNHGAAGWKELMSELPESIRSAIKLELCEKAIYGIEIFRGMKQSEKLQLMDHFEAFTFIPGEVIYKEGDPCTELFIFTSGTIRHVKDNVMFKQSASENFFAGDREFLFLLPRVQTAIADTFVDGWRLRRHLFAAMVNASPSLNRLIMRNARRTYPSLFSGLSRQTEFVVGDLNAPLEHEEIYASDDFVDIERGESSTSSD